MLITSNAESFFSQVDVNTVLLIAEMRATRGPRPNEYIQFVTLKKRLEELFPPGPNYWPSLLRFTDSVEEAKKSRENDAMRIKTVDANRENVALHSNAKAPRNWSLYLRAPLSYYELFGDTN